MLAGALLGGCWVGNVCNAMFLTVRIQIDSCPFRSTQKHYCAFDSAVVLLLTQSPMRSVSAGGRSEHPETPLSQRKPRAAEHIGSPLLPLCLTAAQGQQLGAISSCLSCTGELFPQQRCHPEQAPCMPITSLSDIMTIMNTNNENIFEVVLFCIIGSAGGWWRPGAIFCNSWEVLLL